MVSCVACGKHVNLVSPSGFCKECMDQAFVLAIEEEATIDILKDLRKDRESNPNRIRRLLGR